MALLQPPPEVYELFNDVLLLSEGAGVAPGLPLKAALSHSLRSLSPSPPIPVFLPHTPHRLLFEAILGTSAQAYPTPPYAPARRAGGVLGAAHRRGALLRVDGLQVSGAQSHPRLPAGGQLCEGPGGAHPSPISPMTSRVCLRWLARVPVRLLGRKSSVLLLELGLTSAWTWEMCDEAGMSRVEGL
jgi:hypothetical protein